MRVAFVEKEQHRSRSVLLARCPINAGGRQSRRPLDKMTSVTNDCTENLARDPASLRAYVDNVCSAVPSWNTNAADVQTWRTLSRTRFAVHAGRFQPKVCGVAHPAPQLSTIGASRRLQRTSSFSPRVFSSRPPLAWHYSQRCIGSGSIWMPFEPALWATRSLYPQASSLGDPSCATTTRYCV